MNYKPFGRSVFAGKEPPQVAAAVAVPVLAASVVTGTTMAPACPQPTLAVSASALQAKPAAHIINFGSAPAGKQIHPRGHAKSIKDRAHRRLRSRLRRARSVRPVVGSRRYPAGQVRVAAVQRVRPAAVLGKNRQHLPEDAKGDACPANV